MAVIMGTAGHIDHGTTSLVRALTGSDCERLEEETRRGITIELGFAYFTLPDGRTVTVPRAEGGSEPQPSVPHILYAVGQELVPGQGHYYATLWKDGKRQLLTAGSADSFCNGVYVAGNKVYVVGCEAIGDLFDD